MTYRGVSTLERPEAFTGRATLTDAEVEDLKKRVAAMYAANQAGDIIGDQLLLEVLKDPSLRPFDVGTGNYNTFWITDRDWDNRTSLIVDPPDGRIPPRVPRQGPIRRASQGTGDGPPPAGPEELALNGRCLSFGVPYLVAGYNSNFEILQSANYVAIAQEMLHKFRLIPLDRRPHVGQDIRLWNGDSRGRWEGNTLVVDTTNDSDSGALRGASETLHLVERFTRVAPDMIELKGLR